MNDRREPTSSPRRRLRARGVDFADILLFAVPFLSLFPLRNNDLWWHLASGREMLARGRFVRSDPFSFTGFMGAWIDNEWLSQLAFYGTWAIGGNLGLVVLRACLYTAVFLVIRTLVRSARQPSAFLPGLVVGIALSFGWWELRPSVFSILGTLLLLVILERIRRTGRGFVALPLLFLAWASLHPGFLFGLGVLVGTVAALFAEPLLTRWPRWTSDARTPRKLAAWSALAIAATLANPYGWGVYHQQAVIAGNTAYRAILDEWAPPPATFVVLVLLTVVAFLVTRYRRVAPAGWIPFLGAAALSTTAVRFEEYFALVAVPSLLINLGPPRAPGLRRLLVPTLMIASLVVGLRAPLTAATPEGRPSDSAPDRAEARVAARLERNAIFLSGVLAVGVAATFARHGGRRRWLVRRWRGRARRASVAAALGAAAVTASLAPRLGLLPDRYVEPDRYPEACLSALSSQEARVFNRLSWGGWLIWRSRVRTFIDGRCWGQPIFFEYQRSHGPGWRAVFDHHDIGWAIVFRNDTIAAELSRAADWEPVCRDGVAVVYRRVIRSRRGGARRPPSAPAARRRRLRSWRVPDP